MYFHSLNNLKYFVCIIKIGGIYDCSLTLNNNIYLIVHTIKRMFTYFLHYLPRIEEPIYIGNNKPSQYGTTHLHKLGKTF